MDAHCAIELKAPGFDKGGAIAAFLSTPAFRGRTPVFVGDDTTDESGFAVVAARGGFAYSVGRLRPGAIGAFPRAARGARLARRIRRSRRTAHDRAAPNKEAEPRSGADRQQLLRRPRRPQRPHRVVVLPLFRFRSGVLAAARRRRREGLLRGHARGSGRDRVRATCATRRSSRRS